MSPEMTGFVADLRRDLDTLFVLWAIQSVATAVAFVALLARNPPRPTYSGLPGGSRY